MYKSGDPGGSLAVEREQSRWPQDELDWRESECQANQSTGSGSL